MANSGSIEASSTADQATIVWPPVPPSYPSSEKRSLLEQLFTDVGQAIQWLGDHFFIVYLFLSLIAIVSFVFLSHGYNSSRSLRNEEKSTRFVQPIKNKNPRRLRRYLHSQRQK